jgi:hypothetical protein
MAEVKNSFISSKMNKDLDDRLVPNGEYRNAVNVSINKSTGENVGTAQTVLGNQLLVNYGQILNASSLEVIGVLPDDSSNTIYSFLTNNTLERYVPVGAVGVTSTYPSQQNSFDVLPPVIINNPGQGYDNIQNGSTTNVSVANPNASGLLLSVVCDPTAAVSCTLISGGSGYPNGLQQNINTIAQSPSTGFGAIVSYFGANNSVTSPTITFGGTGYNAGDVLRVLGGGSGINAVIEISSVNNTGAITSVEVKNSGFGYSIGDIVQVDGFDPSGFAAEIQINSLLLCDNFVVSFNINELNQLTTIAKGSFLNFSTLNPINGINLLEELLFFTDNRNQPRKLNVTRIDPYYTTEDQISVAKYYPFDPIQLYQPSEVAGAIYDTGEIDAVSDSKIINFNVTPTQSSSSSLGVIGTFAQITSGGENYGTGNGNNTVGGTGFGLTIDIDSVDPNGSITGITVDQPGNGYTNGDVVTIFDATGNGQATATVSVVKDNTFVTDVTNWPNSISVNQTQNLPAGMTVSLVEVETTMQNAISLYLPPTATSSIFGVPSANQFEVYIVGTPTIPGFVGVPELVGLNVWLKNSNDDFVNTTSVVTSVSIVNIGGVDYYQIQVSPNIVATGLSFQDESEVLFALPNPYYDTVFEQNANVEFLNDKFVRFSYRYRYDDGEYSLIAPFTQPTFIPEQDGYFRTTGVGVDDGVSDELKAYRSTEVDFMENKVNKVLLNIPLPTIADSISSEFKVTDIEILYKESDQTTIKVVETIPVKNNIFGSSPFYQYEYGSKPPFKTLPQSETVRVSDKIPVKAFSQEISSNRVIYGNYQDKHTPPRFLNYTLAAESKNPSFVVTDNKVDNYTSIIEYPNASLKQNRTYEVGVVLSDRFGRQSTVIFSKTKLALQQSFIASSLYSPYRTEFDNDGTGNNPTGGLLNYDGDSLKIQFLDAIQSFKSPDPNDGVPGIYNGDISSPDYNPLGWYSFKIVVKQTEQDYYNVYLPTAMAGYPLDPTKEIETTTHVVLFNDNINKIPRDLTEVGPTQREFPSSVRMFGRVSDNFKGLGTSTNQFYPGRNASLSTSVGTIRDLFDYNAFPEINTGVTTGQYIFYNFDYISTSTGGGNFENSYPDSSSLVARIEGDKIGVPIPAIGGGLSGFAYSAVPKLNVFETAPTVSLLDIYYETTTSGKVSDLNKAILEGPAANVFADVTPFAVFLAEDMLGTNGNDIEVTGEFRPQRFDGSDFTNPSQNGCRIISVTNLLGAENDHFENEDSVPYHVEQTVDEGIFGIQEQLNQSQEPSGSFKIILTKSPSITTPGLVVNKTLLDSNIAPANGPFRLKFDLEFTNPEAEEPFQYTTFLEIQNKAPENIVVQDRNRAIVPCCSQDVGCNPTAFNVFNREAIPRGNWLKVNATNGSKTQSLEKLGLSFEIFKIVDYSTPQGVVIDPTIGALRYFFLTEGPAAGLGGGGPFSDAQAIINIPDQNLLDTNRTYMISLKVTDGGVPGMFRICDLFVVFNSSPLVSWTEDLNSGGCDSQFTPVQAPVAGSFTWGASSGFFNRVMNNPFQGWLFGQGGAANPNSYLCNDSIVTCDNEIPFQIKVDNAPVDLYLTVVVARNWGSQDFVISQGTVSTQLNVLGNPTTPQIVIPAMTLAPGGTQPQGANFPLISGDFITLEPQPGQECGTLFNLTLRAFGEAFNPGNSAPVLGYQLLVVPTGTGYPNTYSLG